jgi:diacylglycerol kinase (ATP)
VLNACLIANPAAGGGRGRRDLPAIREALAQRGVVDVRLTRAPGDESRLARDAAATGIRTIIALGGDGTWGNAARGILESGRDARLALLAAGTGNDFALGMGLPARDASAMIDIAVGDADRRIDMGTADGVPFLNVAGFGIETSVLEALRRASFLRGPTRYLAAALPLLLRYEALPAVVPIDSEMPAERRYLAIILANGRRFGGGFDIAPGASLTDGVLDLIAVADAPVLRRARILWRAWLGTHLGLPEVRHRRVSRLEVTFPAPPAMDVDGELTSARAARVEVACLPQALRLVSH